MNLDVEHLQGWIGREETRSELLTPTLAERFNATFDRTGDVSMGAVAPVMIHLCLALPVAPTSELCSDGHLVRGDFLPPVSLPRRMWAGGAFTFHDDIHVGETITRNSTIKDVQVKQGRTGILCFVTVEHKLRCGARHVVTERHDIVYRDGNARASSTEVLDHIPPGRHQKVVTPTSTLLFRYSALTFNGHRIHYDASYTRDVEKYEGLIVHGPIQATMLVQFAEAIRGGYPARFTFRSLSPLFSEVSFTLNAEESGESLRLWTSCSKGGLAMEALAEW